MSGAPSFVFGRPGSTYQKHSQVAREERTLYALLATGETPPAAIPSFHSGRMHSRRHDWDLVLRYEEASHPGPVLQMAGVGIVCVTVWGGGPNKTIVL